MRWATRRHCHVDRAACAWLIRRFLDSDAEFVFVDDPDEVSARRELYRRLAAASEALKDVAERVWYSVLKES